MAVTVVPMVVIVFVMMVVSIALWPTLFNGADSIGELALFRVFDSELGVVVVGVVPAVADGEGAHEGGFPGRAGATGGPPVQVEVDRLLHEVHGEEAGAGQQGFQVEGKIAQGAILCNKLKEIVS